MNIEDIREYCLSKPFTTEGFPFDETTLVFKVMGKMFAIMGLEQIDPFINLKCDPEKSVELREEYEDVQPGWHMSKVHWNSVYVERGLDKRFIIQLIDHSYELIVAKLPKKVKIEMGLA